MTIRTASHGSHGSIRTRFVLGAVAGVALVGGLAGDLVLRHSDTRLSPVTTAAVSQRAADTMGGYAEYLKAHPVSPVVSTNDDLRPVGGYAEELRDRQSAAATAAEGVRPIGGYAEFMRDHQALPATAALSSADAASPASGPGLEALGFGFSGDGRPMGGYAEWLLAQAQ